MKKLWLLFGIAAFSVWSAHGQNVGIGEPAPTAKLEVKGNGSTSASSTLLIKNSSNTPELRVLDNGNVGIGNITPGYILDVAGRARLQSNTLNNLSNTPGVWLTDYRSNSNIVFAGMADSVNFGLWSDRSGIGWQFYYDARYGNVGIGRKPISGNTRLALDHPSGSSMALYNNGSYSGELSVTDSTLILDGKFGLNLALGGTSTSGDIIFWAPKPSGGPFMPIYFPGKIGMYTNEPNSKVHIVAGTGTSGLLVGGSSSVPATGYMLNVDGKVICEELKVQLNTAWPDYVFEQGYEMPALSDLEKQVMDQKHLPGIPSASTVMAEKGIEVGDMQKRLLEKVEELYRYIFQINNENESLKKRISQLEQKMK